MVERFSSAVRQPARRVLTPALLLAGLVPALLTVSLPRRCEAIDFKKLMRAAPQTQPAGPAETFEAVDLPLNEDGVTGDRAKWLKAFEPKPEKFSGTVQLIEEEDDLRFYRLVFPSPVNSPWPENNVVPCELYLPKAPEGQAAAKSPAAIVLDIMDGSAIVPRGLARGLAQQGVVAMYVPMACFGPRRPKGDVHLRRMVDDPGQAIDNVRQTVMDIRRAKAILAARPDVDPHQIAITGVSLGGIVTALAAGVDGQFNRVVPILAGGDLAEMVFSSARETRQMREAMAAKGMSRDDAERFLAPIEPLNFASRIAPATCLMINASNDEVIPKDATEKLNKAIGSPQILWHPLGHYSSIFYLPKIRQSAVDFIKGKKVESLDGPAE
jgi:dienelactone hydrolase